MAKRTPFKISRVVFEFPPEEVLALLQEHGGGGGSPMLNRDHLKSAELTDKGARFVYEFDDTRRPDLVGRIDEL